MLDQFRAMTGMVKAADDTKARVMLTRRFFPSVRVESGTGGASATSGDKRSLALTRVGS